MFKKTALVALLIGGAEALKISERSIAKHAFIKNMRAAQKAKGRTSKKMNWSKLTDKSIHKPGLRAKTENVNDRTNMNPIPKAPEQKQDDRELNWWNFWKKNVTDDQIEDLWDAMEETNYTQNQNNGGNWWTWNWNFTDDQDDMWVRQGENVTYIINGLSSFSMKYAGCSSLTSYVGTGEDGDSFPFITNNYVSYRLCPKETCRDDKWSGCKQVYGEYMMDMEEFLEVQQSFVDEEFEAYCTYCENCVYFDKWYSGWNFTTYDEQVHGCDLYDQCIDEETGINYEEICDDKYQDEEQEEQEHAYEEFLECTEVEVDLSYYGVEDNGMASGVQENMNGEYGYDMDGDYQMQKAYVGPHCDNGVIGIGLFADEDCTRYVGNKFDILNVTAFEMEANVIDDVYVPDGCHSCAGDNLKNSKWYVPDDREGDEYMEYVEQNENGEYQDSEEDEQDYKVCYEMYIASAKCQKRFTEEYNIPLQESDNEVMSEELACDFIDDVIKGHIDDEGFVWSHQQRVNPISKFFSLTADDIEKDMTDAQLAALVLGAIACAGMAALAVQMKAKIDGLNGAINEGLL